MRAVAPPPAAVRPGPLRARFLCTNHVRKWVTRDDAAIPMAFQRSGQQQTPILGRKRTTAVGSLSAVVRSEPDPDTVPPETAARPAGAPAKSSSTAPPP